MSGTKKKIIILGGGISALSAAYYLTSESGWQNKYDVTVYQRGWRLGGKAASGRNMEQGARIEGLGATHVWGGSYENAFRLIRSCYEELGRPAGAPLRDWDDAFSKQPMVYFEEELSNGATSLWPLDFPVTSDLPGEGKEYPSIWSIIERLTGWLVEAMRDFPLTTARDSSRQSLQKHENKILPAWLAELSRDAVRVVGKVFDNSPFWLLREAWGLSKRLLTNDQGFASDMVMLVDYLSKFLDWLEEGFLDEIKGDTSARRAYILMVLAITVVKGLITDNILDENFYVIDDYDLREWLRRHGAEDIVVDSAPVKGVYDFFFAYQQGDPSEPRLSAGVALNHMTKLVGAYKGSIFWKLNAGTGDVIFAPLYEVLLARGVEFKFFAQVNAIRLDANYEDIDEVEVAFQAEVQGGQSYDPLVEVKDLKCWPSSPNWDQLVDGQQLKAHGVDFEARQGGWTPVSQKILKKGVDFDVVISGISIGELPVVAEAIIENKRGWGSMIDQVEAVPTVSMRLDFNEDRLQLGWRQTNALLSGFRPLFTSWEDCTAWIVREDWPSAEVPKNISTYCGVLNLAQSGAGIKSEINHWLNHDMDQLFPNSVDSATHTFEYSKLIAPAQAQGADRLDYQWVYSSKSPSDYVALSLPRRSRFRISPNSSTYASLVLTGDWLYTGFGGTMEAAVMTGMMASRALCGFPEKIAWEVDVYPWQRESSVERL